MFEKNVPQRYILNKNIHTVVDNTTVYQLLHQWSRTNFLRNDIEEDVVGWATEDCKIPWKARVKNCTLIGATLGEASWITNSTIKYGRECNGVVEDATIVDSNVESTVVVKNSTVIGADVEGKTLIKNSLIKSKGYCATIKDSTIIESKLGGKAEPTLYVDNSMLYKVECGDCDIHKSQLIETYIYSPYVRVYVEDTKALQTTIKESAKGQNLIGGENGVPTYKAE